MHFGAVPSIEGPPEHRPVHERIGERDIPPHLRGTGTFTITDARYGASYTLSDVKPEIRGYLQDLADRGTFPYRCQLQWVMDTIQPEKLAS